MTQLELHANHLCYGGFPNILEEFCDVNWIFDSDEVKSTSRYVFTLGENAFSQKFAKKTYITRFTMKGEFIVFEKASSKVEQLRNFLLDIPFTDETKTICVYTCDSQVAIVKAKSKLFNGKKNIYA